MSNKGYTTAFSNPDKSSEIICKGPILRRYKATMSRGRGSSRSRARRPLGAAPRGMAGPRGPVMRMSMENRISKPKPVIKVRNFMPETWIFENYLVDGESLDISTKVPDTITSWEVKSYCLGSVSSLRSQLFWSIFFVYVFRLYLLINCPYLRRLL